jgi:hypothetical protein
MVNKYTQLADGISRSSVEPLKYIDIRNITSPEVINNISVFNSDIFLFLLLFGCLALFVLLAIIKFSKGSVDI